MRPLIYAFFLFYAITVEGADTVDFAKEVQPILKQNCYKCHFDKKKKGGFSLNTKESILKGGKEGNDVIPGNSKDSLLIKLILSKDDTEYMPPKGARLSEAEIETLKKWIDQKVPMENETKKDDKKDEKKDEKAPSK